MKLAVYYLLVSVAFAGLAFISPDLAHAAVVGFIALLLIPAVYGEWLRVRKG